MVEKYYTEFFFQFIALVISVYSLRKQSVTFSGFVSMVLISSLLIWNDGLAALIVLFSMYASSSLLTHYKQVYKESITSNILQKKGPRDFVQAICNLGIAFGCFLFFKFTNDVTFILAMLSSVAASNADSWASEIGILSKSKPRLITTFNYCTPGISGGITLLGTLAGFAGSAFIAFISVLLSPWLLNEKGSIGLFLLVFISGSLGVFMDSFLGATVQVIYKNKANEETENRNSGIEKVRGVNWINNDWVNFFTSFLVALCIYLVKTFTDL